MTRALQTAKKLDSKKQEINFPPIVSNIDN